MLVGWVYLIHLKKPLCPTRSTQHYLGFTDCLPARIQSHLLGFGARLMQVAKERNIDFEVVRVWFGTRALERQLKEIHGNRLCPICSPGSRRGRFAKELTPAQIQYELIPF